jgi:hypothetical protein
VGEEIRVPTFGKRKNKYRIGTALVQGELISQKIAETDPAGILEKPCSGNLLGAKHRGSMTLEDFTLGNVLHNPSTSKKTALQGCGSIPGGSV